MAGVNNGKLCCLLCISTVLAVLVSLFKCRNRLPPAGMGELCSLTQAQSIHGSCPLAVICPVCCSATFFCPNTGDVRPHEETPQSAFFIASFLALVWCVPILKQSEK